MAERVLTENQKKTHAGSQLHIARTGGAWHVQPLESVTVTGGFGSTMVVLDGNGKEYFRCSPEPVIRFKVGGSLGTHTVRVLDENGKVLESITFETDCKSGITDESGIYKDLFDCLTASMWRGGTESVAGTGTIEWRGEKYRWYVPWILDHCHTAKGMQYQSDATVGLIDLMSKAQRDDGMIWSFVRKDEGPGFYDSAYGADGFARRDSGALFARQPVENHNECNFVESLYIAWKGNGNDTWMKSKLECAMKALDYSVADRCRWSQKFGLLKRGYTIDSWDFQVADKYTVEFDLATSQRIDPDRTKFGIFFGDNTGYALGCDMLSEMLDYAGRKTDAIKYARRAADIRKNLDSIAWNGKFYTHRIEEDPAVVRDLGVDEKSQIAMSNCYALNRGVTHEQAKAIIKTYLDLRKNLPAGSPGEWYAIYPPFGKGFGRDNGKWQYMNGGVHGHAAGELARGAFEHGFEQYGADILKRIGDLGAKHGKKVYFAYTGAVEPPPPAQIFTPVSIDAIANMDLYDTGTEGVQPWMGEGRGNDMRNLPVGRQEFAGIPWVITDPSRNGRKAVIAVSHKSGYAGSIDIPLGAKAGAVCLLHTVSGIGGSQNAGSLTFIYTDGSESSIYIRSGTHLTGWWYPSFKQGNRGGVAWRGPNARSTDVGICWAAIDNPEPDKVISKLSFGAVLDGAIYAVAGITLADRPPFTAPNPVSFGGPDNWSGGTCMYALMEGLAGVKDEATVFEKVRLSPRWSAAGVKTVSVRARYGASKAYVSYQYDHDEETKTVELSISGSGSALKLRILLPAGAKGVTLSSIDGINCASRTETIEQSCYAVINIKNVSLSNVKIVYN